MKYFVIGDEDTVLGLSLVGVQGCSVRSSIDNIDEIFSKTLENKKIGIILITETCADQIRDRVNQFIFTHQFPLIIEIPSREGWKPGRADIQQIVNKAIGIRL